MTSKKVKLDLLDSDGEDDESRGATASSLQINKGYAERYENWRRLEEMQKIKDRYGDDAGQSSSSEEELEWGDEDEKTFLRTLGALKGGDASIYDEKEKFWREDMGTTMGNKNKKEAKKDEKPMYLKDYERKLVTEKAGQIDESDDEDDEKASKDPSYFEQQEEIRRQLRQTINKTLGGDDDDEEDLLVPRKKTKAQMEKEEVDFYEWLKTQKDEDLPDASGAMKSLKKAWTDPQIAEDEKFLRDYLMNKDYETTAQDELPTYDDIVALEEDEQELDRQRDFEHKYNFRFEDPDQEFIKQFPRTVQESLRKENSRRKDKREEYKERKQREKEEKMQELKQLKKMKRQEIEKKLERLKKLAGDDIPLSIDDIQGDFDPKEYDRRMQQVFDEHYYEKEEEVEDEEKPVFSDMSDAEDDSDEASNYDDMEISIAPVEIDEDEEEDENGEEAERTKKKPKQEETRESLEKAKKKKRNRKFIEAIQRKKPVFNAKEKTFEEYFNEYYALDYEDIIGDQVTKFHYRQVVPNDFGLNMKEIISADDRQLNAWASLRKATSYRNDEEERYDIMAYRKKAADIAKKQQIFSTDYGGKKSKKIKELEAAEAVAEETEANPDAQVDGGKKKKKKNKKRKAPQQGEEGGYEEGTGEEAYVAGEEEEATAEINSGEPPQKKKRTRKGKNKQTSNMQATNVDAAKATETADEKPKKKAKNLTGEVSKEVQNGSLIEENAGGEKKKRRRKKKKNSTSEGEVAQVVQTEDVKKAKTDEEKKKKKDENKKKFMKKVDPLASLGVDANRLKAYGLNPNKVKKSLQFGKKKKPNMAE